MILSLLHTTTTLNWKPKYHFDIKDFTKKKAQCMNHFYNKRTQREEKNFPGFDAIRQLMIMEDKIRIRRILWKVK